MAHYYYLRPNPQGVSGVLEEGEVSGDLPEESTPIVLQVYTDDDELILRLGPPSYRAGDAAMKQLMREWQEYAAAAVGLPEEEPVIRDIELFRTFLLERYPAAYRMTQRY